MAEKLTRREALKLAAIGVATLACNTLTNLGGRLTPAAPKIEGGNGLAADGVTATPAAAGEPTAAGNQAATKNYVLPDRDPDASGDLFQVWGVPQNVDPSVVDTAKGDFRNTIGLGTEGWFAEPGKLLVGPDFSQKKIDQAGGAIERFSALNQDSLRSGGPESVELPGGGFTMASLGYGTVKIEGILDGTVTVNLDGKRGHNWLLVVRGIYGDGQPNTDENRTLEFTNYEPGHNEVRFYPGKPNGGFISEGQLEQMAETSATGGTNCGDAGCSELSVLMLDANTGAYTVVTRKAPNQPFEMVASNWR